MALIHLSQDEADALIAVEKVRENNKIWQFPLPGDIVHVPVLSRDRKTSFILDVRRGRIGLKATYQQRVYVVVPLVRLDVGGPPHRNPDDVEIPSPHIHIYRAGYGDRWAEPLPAGAFSNPADLWQTLFDFMAFCNIVETPEFQKSLF